MLYDYDTYIILVNKEREARKPLLKKQKQVWTVQDKSLPIIVETRLSRLKLEEPEVWFVRILVHKVRGKCIDIRQFKKIITVETVMFEPTENGITMELDKWQQVIDPMFKLMRKHNDK